MLNKATIYGSNRINSFADFVKIWRKNRRLNTQLRQFAQKYGHQANRPREKKFSPEIIIPCYNQGRFLNDTLRSIYHHDQIDITVVNDASTDDTANYIRDLAKHFKFKLITNEVNLNQSGSINRAIKESSNNLFVMLNADDALIRYTPPTVLSIFKKYPQVRLVGGGNVVFSRPDTLALNQNLPERLSYVPKIKLSAPQEAWHFSALNDLNLTMSGSAFLKSAWEAVGGFWDFDQRICSYDDRDFQMRVASLFPVATIEEPLAFYRTNSSVNKSQG